MAEKTLSELRELVRHRFRGTAGDTILTEAINAAIRAAGETWLAQVVDTTTLTIAANDYDYDLPAAVVRLGMVSVRGDTDQAWVEVPGRLWSVGGTPGARVLYLDALKGLGDGDSIRLDYVARLTELTAEDDDLGMGEPAEAELVEYVVTYALSWLYYREGEKVQTKEALAGYLRLADGLYQRAMEIKMRAPRVGRGTVRTMLWARSRG